ncbi:hypothetical protein BABINDRAFT_160369 [Babjeviella inositovora NRRL Y-12698]|uniref:Sphingoid long-chain base transporter RSB1 n=1 Tax=Babjeviella inositovora NRRL Y-12698 TaxID=984486 RepID=A0A1E3QTR8_9ASCO|nr:uncharacterized protein BABINDRAFT_160369 [Babjeviella inositovora NRRL Y-12698]ODQ80934.1 hypothetical protein BABINDRAFT_160369 [Babjeviella inositovora NRRL Y-12698]
MDIPTATIQGITIDGALFSSAAQLASAQKVLSTATATKTIASLSSVVSDASVTLAIISELKVAATATDSSVSASATAAILSLIGGADFSLYYYVPSLPGNLILLIILGLVLGIQSLYTLKYRQLWYWTCLWLGIALEFAGFVARVVSHFQPFNQSAYLCLSICVTATTRFILAAFYCIMDILVIVYGEQFSVLKRFRYSKIFINSDLVTVIILMAGVGTAYSSIVNGDSSNTGTDLFIAGLGFQVGSLSIFIVLWLIFFWRVHKASKFAEPGYNPRFQHLSSTSAMKRFPAYAFVGIVCMYVRAIFKVVEYSEGWTGYLRVHEPYFLVLDGLMVVITGIVMSFPGGYPGIIVRHDVSVKNKKIRWIFYEFEEIAGKNIDMEESP